MSLKAFHIFFVTICSLFAAGMGAWSIHKHLSVEAPGAMYMVLAVGSLVGFLALIVYGVWFVKKTKGFSLV